MISTNTKLHNTFKRIISPIALALLIAMPVSAIAAPDDPEAFADWFVQQNFQGREYHQWKAVFEALTDGKDRSREAHRPIVDSVYVAIVSGDKYHVSESCRGLANASFVLEMDMAEAQERGFEVCSKCK